jgi:20S proteasome alpha/beta subunit
MTIAIALALPDGALLFADGRRSHIDDSSFTATNSHNKINRLTDDLSVATYGLEPITSACLQTIKHAAQPDWNCSKYFLVASIYLPQIFAELKGQLSTSIDLTNTNLETGLVFAGHDHGHPFIGRLLFAGERQVVAQIIRQPGYAAILGGFSCNAEDILLQNINRHPNISHTEENDYGAKEVGALKDVISQTIRDVSKHEPTVGGTISFISIRHKNKTETGTLT